MANEQEYNGWTNYETWLVNLHMTNDQSTLGSWLYEATKVINRERECTGILNRDEWDIQTLAQKMQEEHEDCARNVTNLENGFGLWTDLLLSAVTEVNWREIAKHRIEEAQEQLETA